MKKKPDNFDDYVPIDVDIGNAPPAKEAGNRRVLKTPPSLKPERIGFRERYEKRIEDLKKTIADLRSSKREIAEHSKVWKIRAREAEIKVKELERKISRLGTRPAENDSKFKKIKSRFAIMYHPDKFTGEEKLKKQEVFKEFWEEIEKIEKE